MQVVPPDQARKIYAALKGKGLPVALVEFEGEQHGFRKVLSRKCPSVVTRGLLICELDGIWCWK